MPRANINDLVAFVAVASERSFTRAAGKLGVSPSALSHTMRGLEERLGLRLLSRTTRSVSPTEAGERLLRSIGPHFQEIEAQIDALSELRDRPAGTIRLTCSDAVIGTVLQPRLNAFLRQYPDIRVEVLIDHGFTNIVEQRIDAGIRLGEALAKDMIAVRIGPDWRFAVVGSPDYFAHHAKPTTPEDLTAHKCLGIRLTTAGSLYAWEFEKEGRKINARVEGQLVFNSVLPILDATLDGMGPCVYPHGSGPAASRDRTVGRGDGGLVSHVPGLPPLLSAPASGLAGVCAVGGGAEVPGRLPSPLRRVLLGPLPAGAVTHGVIPAKAGTSFFSARSKQRSPLLRG